MTLHVLFVWTREPEQSGSAKSKIKRIYSTKGADFASLIVTHTAAAA